MRKSILCILGLHSTFLDCSYFHSAYYCTRCESYTDKYFGDKLIEERSYLKRHQIRE